MKKQGITTIAGVMAAAAMWIGASTGADAALTHLELTGALGTRAAKATFDVSGSTLTILLENTAVGDVDVPGNVLTALFWDPMADLTPVSAVVGNGSSVLLNGSVIAVAGSAVGGEWAYRAGLSGAPAGAMLGISSSGLGLFGPPDLFPPGTNLQGPVSPDGVQYGIVSAGYSSGGDNGGLSGTCLIKSSVLFTLTTTGTYDLADVRNVSFQYGTALSEPNIPAIPEPTTIIAGALLLLPFGASALQNLRKNRTA